MPAAHRAHMEWTPGRLLNWGASVGPGAEAIVNHLLTNRPHPEMGYRACLGLLSLSRKYGKERLEAACQRALVIGSPTRRSVLSILESGLDRQPTAGFEWIIPDIIGNKKPRKPYWLRGLRSYPDFFVCILGGAEGDRTADLCSATPM